MGAVGYPSASSDLIELQKNLKSPMGSEFRNLRSEQPVQQYILCQKKTPNILMPILWRAKL